MKPTTILTLHCESHEEADHKSFEEFAKHLIDLTNDFTPYLASKVGDNAKIIDTEDLKLMLRTLKKVMRMLSMFPMTQSNVLQARAILEQWKDLIT